MVTFDDEFLVLDVGAVGQQPLDARDLDLFRTHAEAVHQLVNVGRVKRKIVWVRKKCGNILSPAHKEREREHRETNECKNAHASAIHIRTVAGDDDLVFEAREVAKPGVEGFDVVD